jgi:hypothetical protein
VVGTPSYFANKSRPTAPADLMDHECIRARYSSGALYRWEFERHGEAMRIDVPGSLTLDEARDQSFHEIEHTKNIRVESVESRKPEKIIPRTASWVSEPRPAVRLESEPPQRSPAYHGPPR